MPYVHMQQDQYDSLGFWKQPPKINQIWALYDYIELIYISGEVCMYVSTYVSMYE
jgi:hypothetical protein